MTNFRVAQVKSVTCYSGWLFAAKMGRVKG